MRRNLDRRSLVEVLFHHTDHWHRPEIQYSGSEKLDQDTPATRLSRAVFRELGSVVTVEPKWSLEGVFPSRAVSRWPRVTKHARMGWSWGYVATEDRGGRTLFVADAHLDGGKSFVVHSDEKLTAFLELERNRFNPSESTRSIAYPR